MGKRGHSEEVILRVLREAESGDPVVEICRKHGISQQTFYLWKKQYAGLGLSELRELRQLREENGKLKRLVAGQRVWTEAAGVALLANGELSRNMRCRACNRH